MTRQDRERHILNVVSEMDSKLLDATIESIKFKLTKRGANMSYDTVHDILRKHVSDGSIVVEELAEGLRKNRYLPKVRSHMMAFN